MISVLTPSIRPEGLKIVQECLAKQTFKDFEWLVEIGIPERGHDLNKAYNRMLKRANGELIVSYQDFITVDENFLDNCWKKYQESKDTFFTCPVGKVTDPSDPKESVRWDFRKTAEKIDWIEWEIDLAFAPLEALNRIGGFDEELDKYWSFDNVSVGYRAQQHGFNFGIANFPGVAFDHDEKIEHPFRKNYNPKFWNERLDSYKFNPSLDKIG